MQCKRPCMDATLSRMAKDHTLPTTHHTRDHLQTGEKTSTHNKRERAHKKKKENRSLLCGWVSKVAQLHLMCKQHHASRNRGDALTLRVVAALCTYVCVLCFSSPQLTPAGGVLRGDCDLAKVRPLEASSCGWKDAGGSFHFHCPVEDGSGRYCAPTPPPLAMMEGTVPPPRTALCLR